MNDKSQEGETLRVTGTDACDFVLWGLFVLLWGSLGVAFGAEVLSFFGVTLRL